MENIRISPWQRPVTSSSEIAIKNLWNNEQRCFNLPQLNGVPTRPAWPGHLFPSLHPSGPHTAPAHTTSLAPYTTPAAPHHPRSPRYLHPARLLQEVAGGAEVCHTRGNTAPPVTRCPANCKRTTAPQPRPPPPLPSSPLPSKLVTPLPPPALPGMRRINMASLVRSFAYLLNF